MHTPEVMPGSEPECTCSPLLTPGEVARLLRVSSRTVRRLARKGLIPQLRVGSRTPRYDRAAVLAALQRKEAHDDNAD